jgi:hypothetical protein
MVTPGSPNDTKEIAKKLNGESARVLRDHVQWELCKKLMPNCKKDTGSVRGSFHFLPSKVERRSGDATDAVSLRIVIL